jgi:hypothetical protein
MPTASQSCNSRFQFQFLNGVVLMADGVDSIIITIAIKTTVCSELWKMLKALHYVWIHVDGRLWLAHHLTSSKYIVSVIILEFQHGLGAYVRIANSPEYRQAVRDGRQIAPLAYENANEQAQTSSAR